MNPGEKFVNCSKQCKVGESKTKQNLKKLFKKVDPSLKTCLAEMKKNKSKKKMLNMDSPLELDKCLLNSKNSKDYKELKKTRASAKKRIEKCLKKKCKKELDDFANNVVRKVSKKNKKNKK